MQKELQVTYKNMDRSPALDAIIEQRVAALKRLYPRAIGCRVVIEVPHRSAGSAKVPLGVAVELEIPNHAPIIGRDTQQRREVKDDHTAAVNNAFEAVERQLEKLSQEHGREVSRHEAAGETGMILRLFPDQQYGFAQVEGAPELYFTANAVSGGSFDELETGMMVHLTRAAAEGPMGPQASSVRPLGKRKAPE